MVTTADPDPIAAAGALSDAELAERLDVAFRRRAALEGSIVVLLGEVARRQSYRAEGATGPEPWAAERFGVSVPTARALVRVGEQAWELPHLVGSLCAGELSLDKVRAVIGSADAESERALAEEAKGCSVGELSALARRRAAGRPGGEHDEERASSVRFNERCHSVNVRLGPEAFAETRACLEARARAVPSEGETPYDERLGQAFTEVIRSAGGTGTEKEAAGPYVVVAHVPLAALLDEEAEQSTLAAELERDGLISTAVVRRLACEGTVVVGVDDDVGHTMYEGRARRSPNPAQRREVMRRDRHCRFPGCGHVTFTHTHHVVPWKPGGRTDLDNLALLCHYHHHLVHSKGWAMTGDANGELSFVGPSGRVLTSRPSPLWGARSGEAQP